MFKVFIVECNFSITLKNHSIPDYVNMNFFLSSDVNNSLFN